MKVKVCAAVVAGAAIVGAVVVAVVDSWSPEAWGALAAWITAAVAVAAGVAALGQLRELRHARLEQARLRQEQAQPYVVAYIEFGETSTYLVDLVVKNFGATAAHDVHLDIIPVPRRSIDAERDEDRDTDPQAHADQSKSDEPKEARGDDLVWLPDHIPVLAPSQTWRTLWDTGRRTDTDLPDRHTARVSYRDSQGEPYTTEAVLDWRFVKDREMVSVYGIHHAAKALQEMSKSIARWKEGASGGVAVYVRDGDARDERRRQHREARLAEQRARRDG